MLTSTQALVRDYYNDDDLLFDDDCTSMHAYAVLQRATKNLTAVLNA